MRITISVPVSSTQPRLIQELSVSKNVDPFFVDFTSVVGEQILPGDNLQIKIPITIDRAMRKEYYLFIKLTMQLPDNRECTKIEFINLTVGTDLPGIFPGIDGEEKD